MNYILWCTEEAKFLISVHKVLNCEILSSVLHSERKEINNHSISIACEV